MPQAPTIDRYAPVLAEFVIDPKAMLVAPDPDHILALEEFHQLFRRLGVGVVFKSRKILMMREQ